MRSVEVGLLAAASLHGVEPSCAPSTVGDMRSTRVSNLLEARPTRWAARDSALGAWDLCAELMALEDRGWLVSQAVLTDGRGTIDFLITSPAVSFVVDLAAEGTEGPDSARLERHAAWARETYGPTRRVVPVLCVRGPICPERLANGVHRLGAADVVDFLLDRG